MRLKTVFFKQAGGPRPPEVMATVLASTIWRLADKAVANLSKANYDIVTPERGFRIIAELCAFLVHYSDRLFHGRVPDEQRARLLQALGKRLAEVMQENILAVAAPDGHDYQADFIALLNRRAEDYATFDFPGGQPGFPALRYLGNAIMELMLATDQHWVVGQIMEVEAPELIETVQRAVSGLLNPEPARPQRGASPE